MTGEHAYDALVIRPALPAGAGAGAIAELPVRARSAYWRAG
ncbi:hypothetical protein [Streptomyces sp. NPDC059631]